MKRRFADQISSSEVNLWIVIVPSISSGFDESECKTAITFSYNAIN